MEKSLSAESRPTATFGSIVLNIPHNSLLLPNNVRCADTTQLLADINRRADRAADVIFRAADPVPADGKTALAALSRRFLNGKNS